MAKAPKQEVVKRAEKLIGGNPVQAKADKKFGNTSQKRADELVAKLNEKNQAKPKKPTKDKDE